MSRQYLDELNQSLLYQRAPCGLMTVDQRGVILTANHTLLSWLGATKQSHLFRLQDLLRAGDRIYWETHVAPLLAMQGRVSEIAMELVVGDEMVPVLINASAADTHLDVIDLALFRAHDRRAYEHELVRAKKEAELAESRARDLALTLQNSLLPPSIPHVEGLALGAAYRPVGSGAEVGGDFYDVFQIAPTEWMIAIGDVCGKGPEAAALTAMVRYTIRAVAAETRDLQRVISVMNRTLFEEPTTSTLTTVLMKISLGSSSNPFVTTCAAGHPLPLLVGPDGTVTTVGDPGTLLGAFANPETTEETLYLQERASIVLLTDGITDSRQAGEYYDEQRLRERLAAWSGFPPAHIAEGLVDDCIEFQGGVAHDDLAVVVVQHRGVSPA